MTDAERFDARFEVNPTTGCWEWTSTLTHNGYGLLSVRGKHVRAHRWSYEYHVGPIPDGLVVDHLCRVRNCVNPEHLEAVTQKENLRRGIGPIGNHVKKTHCKRGHEFTAENSYVTNAGKRCRRCAADYQIRRRLRVKGQKGRTDD